MSHRRPHVLLIGGYASSGKSELGRILARLTHWPIIDKDTITRPVVEAALETLDRSYDDRESEDYVRIIRPREYEALASTIDETSPAAPPSSSTPSSSTTPTPNPSKIGGGEQIRPSRR